jgi:glucose/arabinose dehydrogenase/mono/diheme cytochrome c family protein
MALSNSSKTLLSLIVVFVAIGVLISLVHARKPAQPVAVAKSDACPNDDSGLALPAGFCATIFADGIGHARHMVASPSGVLYVNTWSGRYFGNDKPHDGGFLVALQDKSGSGKADVNERFGGTVQSGDHGGTGIGIYKGSLFAETNDRIVRYSMSANGIVPSGSADTVVSGLPLGGDHPMHPFLIDPEGKMYVDVATATNACQQKNRTPHSPGISPCTELETRGGVWLYDANKTNQAFSPSDRFATGIRNAEGFAMDASGRIFATQHGRDQLYTNWPERYKPDQEATLPAEEVLLLKKNGDYGWPECYYDAFEKKLVLAPEYGGDGGKKIDVCANKTGAAAVFPAHWGPNAMLLYDKAEFPEHYRGGLFIAFHGSWNRAPYAQGGYNVVYQPLDGDHASAQCEIFADGFAGAVKSPGKAEHRPSGLAVAPDGSLYVSDDIRGRIYKIVYKGGSTASAANVTACPSPTAPAGDIVEAAAKPPEGTHPDAGKAAHPSVPPGATAEMVALGDRVYHGQIGGAPCAGCHGSSGEGTPLGPALTGKEWLWSDGSFAGVKKTITVGVSQPKKYRSPMPPNGGAQLTPEQLSAVAAYVWSLSHQAPSKKN